jgi:eukaryotic-like serine/threonine-protein kinase
MPRYRDCANREQSVIDEGELIAGHYRLLERVGSGSMGVVWRARDERLERVVAIKQLLLQPGLTDEQREDARRRALREARIAARLHHANAIVVFDVAEHEGDPCLVMEYLESRSLAAALADRGSLPVPEAAAMGSQIASALAAAHAVGIVHRDIKPGNGLITDTGVAKLTDFGIARAVGDVTVTQTGMFAGTPAYLAPEVARGQDPTSASDVFSFGAMLYDAVEGGPPFPERQNQLALLRLVAEGKVEPPKQAGELTALLNNLLRPEPGDRPSMSMASELLAQLAGSPSLRPKLAAAVSPTVPGMTPPPAPPSESPEPTAVAETPAEEGPQPPPPTPAVATAASAAAPTTVAAKPAPDAVRRKRMVLIGAVVLVVVLAGVGVLLALLPTGSPTKQASGGGGSTPATSTQNPGGAAPPTSAQHTTTTPTSPSTVVAAAGSAPSDRIAAWSAAGAQVIAFYGSGMSWSMLTPGAQAFYGNSEQQFQAYWAQHTQVQSNSASVVGGTQPDGSVQVSANESDSSGSHHVQVRVVLENGQYLIDSNTQVG